MDETECTASNSIPKYLIEIICILESDEKYHSYKIIRKRKYFTLVTKLPAKNGESTQLKNNASGGQTASHQDKKEVSSEEKLLNRKPKRKKNKYSTLPSGPKSAKQHSDKKTPDSSNAGQPKLKQKPPAVVAMDRARRKEYWTRMKVPRQLRAENLVLFYLLQETPTVASPQVPVVRQPEKSGGLERTSSVSQSFSHLTIERGPVGTARVHSDLNKLSAEAAAEHSGSLLEVGEVSDIVFAHCLKLGSQSE